MKPRLIQESKTPGLEVVLQLSGFGLSIVGPVENPGHGGNERVLVRQEMMYGQLSKVNLKLSRGRLSSLALAIGSIQVDNHLPGAAFPILLAPGGREEEESPFVKLSIIKEVDQSTNTAHYNLVAVRMLNLDVTVDLQSVLVMLSFLQPVEGYLMMKRERLGGRAWVASLTSEALQRSRDRIPGGYVDVEQVRQTARVTRRYFKKMLFHPILMRLSWVKTNVDERSRMARLDILEKIPTVVRSNIGLESYLVQDAFGDANDIAKNITSHYITAATMQASQVLNLVGSVRALGSPADLISNVGSGAKALLYEPVEGLVEGPTEFFEGVGRGANTFVKGTLHGVFNSVAGVGGAAADTVSILTFDEEYRNKRKQQKINNISKGGGVSQGLRQGGQDIVGGVKEGVSGLFSNPLKQARAEGVGGFFKGVGTGLVGAVVKPAIGVADAAVSVVQGISNEADSSQQIKQLRPRRALTLDNDTGHLVMEVYSLEAAQAQAVVASCKFAGGTGGIPRYESHTSVGDLTIIFADVGLVLLKRQKDEPMEGFKNKDGNPLPRQKVTRAWEEVAYCEATPSSIVIKHYQGGDMTL
ncbi:unnamed protein product, partial [Discosporangium mesarthrocarpum]